MFDRVGEMERWIVGWIRKVGKEVVKSGERLVKTKRG